MEYYKELFLTELWKLNDYLYSYFLTSTLGKIELVASILTILCVWLCNRQSIWNFPVGIIAVLLFGYIFCQVQLYADATLQFGYFLPVSFFGWWYWWTQGPGRDDLPIRPASAWEWGLTVNLTLIGTLGAGYYFATYTQAAFPYPDSFILAASIIAQFLLSKKVIENWVLWVAVDLVAIPVYYLKGLYVTSGLYFILLCIATHGLVSWIVSYKTYDKWGRA